MTQRSKWEANLLDSSDSGAERLYSLWVDAQQVSKDEGYWKSLHAAHAAHEVWCSLPKPLRVPRTQHDLAEWLEVDQDTLINWRKKHPARYAASEAKVRQLVQSMVVDVLGAAYANAMEGGKDGAQDRKLIIAAAGVTTASTEVSGKDGGAVTIKVIYDDKPFGPDQNDSL